jgi:hypothetical protein
MSHYITQINVILVTLRVLIHKNILNTCKYSTFLASPPKVESPCEPLRRVTVFVNAKSLETENKGGG